MGFYYLGKVVPLSALVAKTVVKNPDKLIENSLKRALKRASSPETIDKAVWEQELENSIKALSGGWGDGFSAEFGSEDWEFVQNLKYNTALFNAFKNHKYLKDVRKHLFDENGKLRTESEFYKSAVAESDKYLKRYAQTEYNLAFAGAQMASKWRGFEKDADLYPNLEYRAVRDKRTRPDHARLHGTVLPINDPFWNKYYPPNGYGCRCDVTATDKEVTATPTAPDCPKEMEINTGKSARIFDTSHPYYKNTDSDTKAWIKAFVARHISPAQKVKSAFAEFNSTYAQKEWTQAYFDGNTGGFAVYHDKHKFAIATGEMEKETAKVLATNGYKVPLLDESGFTGKCFDTTIKGIRTEIKVMSGPRNIVTRANKAVKQGAERVIYYINFNNDKALYKELSNVSKIKEIKEIWFVKDGELHYYK